MEADIRVENGKMPPCPPTAPDYVPVLYRPRYLPPQMAETATNVNRQLLLFAVLGNGKHGPWACGHVSWLRRGAADRRRRTDRPGLHLYRGRRAHLRRRLGPQWRSPSGRART